MCSDFMRRLDSAICLIKTEGSLGLLPLSPVSRCADDCGPNTSSAVECTNEEINKQTQSSGYYDLQVYLVEL